MVTRRVCSVFSVWVFLFLLALVSVAFNVSLVRGNETIYIRADGSIDPPTAPISTFDNVTYTFTNNINDSIVVERSNIIIDGKGYSTQGNGSGYGFSLYIISNVTIKNANIKGFAYGVYLNSTSQNIVSGNNITDNVYFGIVLNKSSDNKFYHNNFINNTLQVNSTESINTWDDGYPSGGNYWSDFNGTDLFNGPSQNMSGSDGLGDTPYVIDVNNKDRYPLMYRWPDTTPPTGSISIADGATYINSTSVTLNLSAWDTSGISQMRFSNDNQTWSDWDAYDTSRLWALTTGDGVKTVYAQFKDKAGLVSAVYQDTIIVDTKRPTANAGSDQIVDEDTIVTLDGSASQDENGIASYTWTFTDVTPQSLTGKNPTYTYTFATPGIYTITLKVTDLACNYATDTLRITVRDVTKPVANAGPDRTVDINVLITLDGSASSDNVGITTYTWTFTDVTPKKLVGPKPTYTFTTLGTYIITINVTDGAGNWATDIVVITVVDLTKPVANAGLNRTTNVGKPVTFDASASSDNAGIVSYEWDFGDGTTGTGKTTTHTYTNIGNYTVTLTVKDAGGNAASHSITVTVLPAEPFPIWIIGVVLAAIGIAAAATLLLRKRK